MGKEAVKLPVGAKVTVGELLGKVVAEPKAGWVMVKFEDKTEKKVRVSAAVLIAAPVKEGRLVPADLSKYSVHESKTLSGRKHIDVNDETAAKLREKTLDQIYVFAAKTLGETEKDLRAKYGHLNLGMQRMNLGNRIRAAFNAAEVASKGLKEMKKAA